MIVETPLCGYLGVKGCFKIRRRSLLGQVRVFAQQLVEQMFLRGPHWVSGRVESIFLSTLMHRRASFSSNMYGNLLFTMSTQLHYSLSKISCLGRNFCYMHIYTYINV